MKIESLELKNIGVFDDEKIVFPISSSDDKADIHIFTGINGSGKSTLLFALASAFDYFEKGHKNHVSNFFYKRFRFFENTDYKKPGAILISEFGKPTNQNYRSEVTIGIKDEAFVKIYGCPGCKGIHSATNNPNIDNYSGNIKSSPNSQFEFEFVAFAYSGYRYVSSEEVNTISAFKGNPLAQSLEFIKNRAEPNQNYSINQWILNNYSNEALLLKMDKKKESQKYASTLSDFKRFISEIIDKEVDFIVKLNPTRLYIQIDGKELDFDVLPDGLKSLLSWIGDLMMIMDQLKWKNNTPIFEREFVLLLDEIEVHLHPSWQRKILPVIQKLFKNAQIFLSTHSPFIVNSVDGAYIYELEYENGKTTINKPVESRASDSISYTLRKVFGMNEERGLPVQDKLNQFYKLRDKILERDTSQVQSFVDTKKELLTLDDLEIRDIVEFEVNQLYKVTKLEPLLQ